MDTFTVDIFTKFFADLFGCGTPRMSEEKTGVTELRSPSAVTYLCKWPRQFLGKSFKHGE